MDSPIFNITFFYKIQIWSVFLCFFRTQRFRDCCRKPVLMPRRFIRSNHTLEEQRELWVRIRYLRFVLFSSQQCDKHSKYYMKCIVFWIKLNALISPTAQSIVQRVKPHESPRKDADHTKQRYIYCQLMDLVLKKITFRKICRLCHSNVWVGPIL